MSLSWLLANVRLLTDHDHQPIDYSHLLTGCRKTTIEGSLHGISLHRHQRLIPSSLIHGADGLSQISADFTKNKAKYKTIKLLTVMATDNKRSATRVFCSNQFAPNLITLLFCWIRRKKSIAELGTQILTHRNGNKRWSLTFLVINLLLSHAWLSLLSAELIIVLWRESKGWVIVNHYYMCSSNGIPTGNDLRIGRS